MGRMAYAPVQMSAVSTSINLWSIQPATDDPVVLHAFEISNYGADVGDAEEENLELHLIRRTGSPTSGTGGAVTEVNADQAGGTLTATVLQELTADWTAGTAETLAYIGWNIRAPYLFMPPPEGRITVKDNDVLLLDLVTVPTDAVDLCGWILYEEL